MSTRDLLFELGTEELPPRTLQILSAALTAGLTKGMDDAGIPHRKAHGYATPRRLAVRIDACAEVAPDRRVERRGPPVASAFDAAGAPTQAATAFAKSCGVAVADLERLTTEKGAWMVYRGCEPGAATVTLLKGIVNQAIAALPIAKRMRWGASAVEFVRPVHSVLLIFGEEVVPIEVLGATAGRITHGHRFHAPRALVVRRPRSYEGQLRRAKVVADFAKRRDMIRAGVMAAAAEAGGTALIEPELLDEVTALVEWPVPIAGRFDERFLELPREVVIATVQDHQRYFPVEGADGRLTGGFVTVSNIQSRDPSKVREGNERVVRPRLSDAVFFWDQDRKVSLDGLVGRLGSVTFQTKLGSYAQKTARVRLLAADIGERISASSALVIRSAELAKADLMSAMVGEFPELQGIMGRYYAEAQGEPEEVARAIEEHYRPRYAGDALPVTRSGQALSLADKIDTLVGIFAIEQRPTGTKDPFGLRRAALGVLRILLECRLDLDLHALLRASATDQPVLRPGVGGGSLRLHRRAPARAAARARGRDVARNARCSAGPPAAFAVGRRAAPRSAQDVLAAARSPRADGHQQAHREHPAQGAAALRHGAGSGAQRTTPRWRCTQAVTDSSGAVEQALLERRYTEALTRLTGLSRGRRPVLRSGHGHG